MITTATSSTAAAPPAQSMDAAPAVAAAAVAAPAGAAAPVQAAPGAAAPGAAAPAAAARDAAQPFARWLGQQIDAAAVMPDAMPLPAQPQAAASGVPAADSTNAPAVAKAEANTSTDDTPAAAAPAAAQDTSMLAAMALPMMPFSAVLAAQALQAMLPAQGAGGKKDDIRAALGAATATAGPATAAVQSMPPAGTLPAPRAQSAGIDADMDAAGSQAAGNGAAALSLAALPRDQQDAAGAPATRMNVGAATDGPDDATGRTAATTASSTRNNGVTIAPGSEVAALAAAPAQNAPAADTVKLAGPPAAWRQSLQEALGDKLHVQVTNNVEQAVIRLEPPQLGRIDIAIRHSAGTLEVNISASNGEVLRQLQTVSDNLRSDLSQRQFTEVAVTVAPMARQGNATPFGDPQQPGRGRQQARDQENEPGRALADGDTAKSAFTLAGRE
jgi:flagellar hook-length control protein FliK